MQDEHIDKESIDDRYRSSKYQVDSIYIIFFSNLMIQLVVVVRLCTQLLSLKHRLV